MSRPTPSLVRHMVNVAGEIPQLWTIAIAASFLMARTKLPEIEAIIERATTMRRLLNVGLECQCISLEDCLSKYDQDTLSRHLNS